jgi:hypothetical protein
MCKVDKYINLNINTLYVYITVQSKNIDMDKD